MLNRSIAAIAFVALAASFASFGLLPASAMSEGSGSSLAPSISAAELHSRSAALVVIDVRTSGEYASGHIPGAVNIPFDQIAERISEVDAPDGVVLYCMVGPRARKGEAALQAVGFEKILHLEGGFAAWRAAGLAVASKK